MNNNTAIKIIKVMVGLAVFIIIYFRLRTEFTSEKITELQNTFNSSRNYWMLLLTISLFPVNWILESLKWKKITHAIEPISLFTAIKSVLVGLCVGNLTPGRLGEFAGRILFFKSENRAKASVTHFVCGITQLITTMFIGVISMLFFVSNKFSGQQNFYWILFSCLLFLTLLIWLILRINNVYNWLRSTRFFKTITLGEMRYEPKVIAQLFGLSFVRYLVFSFQYVLLLFIFGASTDFLTLWMGVAISFMLMSAIPMISFIEVAVRAAIAVLIFGSFQSNGLQLITASTLLWLINIIIPSILGYIILVAEKIPFTFKTKIG